MKIAVLGTRGFPQIQGGVEAHCENLYPRIAEKGNEVIVFTRKPYVTYPHPVFQQVKLVPLSCPKNKFLEAFLHTFIGVFAAKKIKADVLHIHAIGPCLFVPLARLLGLKVIITHHGPDYQRKKWGLPAKMILKTGEFLGVTFADKIITISNPIAESIKNKFKKFALIIPNGVVLPEIIETREILKKYSLEKGNYILAVGRFVPEKGFHDLIEAFGRLQATSDKPQVKLVIAGAADHEDEYSKNLKAQAEKNKDIILTGFLTGDSLKELYANAGIFILSSYYEGLPIVLLEAMSYGLSCLASDIPANREVSLARERFFKPGDIKAIAGKLKEFINKPLSQQDKEKQVARIAEKYNWDKIADETLRVYQ